MIEVIKEVIEVIKEVIEVSRPIIILGNLNFIVFIFKKGTRELNKYIV